MSKRDTNCFDCLEKCEDHFSVSFIARTSNSTMAQEGQSPVLIYRKYPKHS